MHLLLLLLQLVLHQLDLVLCLQKALLEDLQSLLIVFKLSDQVSHEVQLFKLLLLGLKLVIVGLCTRNLFSDKLKDLLERFRRDT